MNYPHYPGVERSKEIEEKRSMRMERSKEIMPTAEWKPFEHQVAGHLYGKEKLGMLVSKQGMILKPVQAFPKGEREVKFYEDIFKSSNPSQDVLDLKKFLPHYYGVVELPSSWQDKQINHYLSLENLVMDFNCPCILDVKVGKCCWDQYASKEKISREIAKCPFQHETGFRILGIKVYDSQNKNYHFDDRYTCRKISNEEDLHKALLKYVSCSGDEQMKQATLSSIITKLNDIEHWFLKQRSFSFKSSSVLIIFEGDNSTRKGGNSPLDNTCSQVDVKMIDFTHVFQSSEPDLNYLQGLSSLISYLKKCL